MNEKKLSGLILIAVIIAFGAYAIAQVSQNTADSNANITNIFQIVVNNTDLGYPNGTHERMPKTTYYANNSPLAIALVGHIVGSGSPKHLDMNLSVNGTVVQNQDIETNPGQNIHDHASIYFILPKGSYYSVDNSTTVSYLNWYEYPILSGRNGTLSVNQTVVTQNIVGGGVTAVQANAPLTYNNNSGNITIFDNRTEYPNGSKWNKSDNLNSTINITASQIQRKGFLSSGTGQSVTTAYSVITFSTVIYNNNSNFNGSHFIVNEGGLYLCEVNVYYPATTINNRFISGIYKNNNEERRTDSGISILSPYATTFTYFKDLNVNDQLTVNLYSSTTTSISYSSFGCEKIK